jgi:hypothetical protein
VTTGACDEFRDVAPDLALGLLSGDERGAAISHVATCASCRHHLEGLVQVADDLLLLAPSVEPEIGFESRVMTRLAADGAFTPSAFTPSALTPSAFTPSALPPAVTAPAIPSKVTVAAPASSRWSRRDRRGRHRATLLALAAALVVVVGVAGLLTGLTRGRAAGRISALSQEAQGANQLAARTVVLRADGGHSLCQLVAFPGAGAQPARLVISLDEPGEPSGSYQVLAQPADGRPAVLVGTITMAAGHGLLTAAIPPGTGPVNEVRIVEPPGNVKYHATFAPV